MSTYLTIPEITDAEPVSSWSRDDDRTYRAVIAVGDTAVHLMNHSSTGQMIPLVVLMTDTVTLALDNVVVSSAQVGTVSDAAMFTFAAEEVRFI